MGGGRGGKSRVVWKRVWVVVLLVVVRCRIERHRPRRHGVVGGEVVLRVAEVGVGVASTQREVVHGGQ